MKKKTSDENMDQDYDSNNNDDNDNNNNMEQDYKDPETVICTKPQPPSKGEHDKTIQSSFIPRNMFFFHKQSQTKARFVFVTLRGK